jgi:hypothetical protein
MTLSKAKQEFQVRYYLWATSEWENEINEGFPNLRSFKAGRPWETYQFMQQLGKHEQMLTARGLLKQSHADAVKTLGETYSPDEETFRWRCDHFFNIRQQHQWLQQLLENSQPAEAAFLLQMFRADAAKLLGEIYFTAEGPLQSQRDAALQSQLEDLFRPVPTPFEEELAARRKAGEKVRFASKRKLQTAIMQKFKNEFGDHVLDSNYDDICDPSSSFELECYGGWNISTHFWFGRRQNLIEYSQGIASELTFQLQAAKGTYTGSLGLGPHVASLCAWLGIGATQWPYITNGEEVDLVCDMVIKHCHHFFEVAPKLLKGLEVENITVD